MVDIGNEWHGMAYFTEDEWRELRDKLTLLSKVTVRVHKVRTSRHYCGSELYHRSAGE